MRTLLFDIDGTLLLTNGGGSNAVRSAIEQEFGVERADTDISYSGRTDRAILIELLQRNHVPETEENQQRLADCYTTLFPGVLADRGGRLLPGAVDLLERLRGEPDILCYVMTGNLLATATRKLDHFGLLPFFRGIFGGDHDSDRDELARRTARSLRQEHGASVVEDVIVIGDTPADVRCGHAIGAQVVAVCTGNFARADLEAEEPMTVHDDMSDVDNVYRWLTRSRSTSNGKQR